MDQPISTDRKNPFQTKPHRGSIAIKRHGHCLVYQLFGSFFE
jgi:hypothetical protein